MDEVEVSLYFIQSVAIMLGFILGLVYNRLFREARCPVCDKPKEYVEV
jgi:hypothetical protein